MLNKPDVFQDFFSMLGKFHLTKVLLQDAGRSLNKSDALVKEKEEKVFGSAVSGCHRVRSFQYMFLVSEAVYSFAWKVFWKIKQNSPSLVNHLNNHLII